MAELFLAISFSSFLKKMWKQINYQAAQIFLIFFSPHKGNPVFQDFVHEVSTRLKKHLTMLLTPVSCRILRFLVFLHLYLLWEGLKAEESHTWGLACSLNDSQLSWRMQRFRKSVTGNTLEGSVLPTEWVRNEKSRMERLRLHSCKTWEIAPHSPFPTFTVPWM